MDIKGSERFLDMLLGAHKEYGFEEAQAAFIRNCDKTVSIRDGEVESFENSDNQKLIFEGLRDGHIASSVTSLFDEDSVKFLLENTSENVGLLTEKDEDFIYCDPANSEWEILARSPKAQSNTYDKYAKLGLELEKELLALDPAVEAVESLSVGGSETDSIKKNSKGLRIIKDNNDVSVYAEVRAVKDGVVKNAGNFWYGRDIDGFAKEKDVFLQELKDDLMGKFGGGPVDSGNYDVLLDREAVVSLIGTFFGAFSSANMQKGLSLLDGKEGTVIASEKVTLREEPMYEQAMDKIPLDGDNYPTSSKAIIDKGVFSTALYSLKTANKAGRESTGNGYGGAVSATNLVLVPGEKSRETIFREMKDGLYIKELSGLHAGANPISGDFSLLCEGYLIKDGKKDRYVEQITVSGNFFDVLKDITDVANDTKAFPGGKGEFFSCSVRISKLAIAG